MIQGILYIIQLIVITIFSVTAIAFILLAISKRKNKKQLFFFGVLSVIFIITTFYIYKIDLYSNESTDRKIAIGAFESNFEFKPPSSIEEIKVKNFGIYDSYIHWMSFTYNSAVFNKILAHDQPLKVANRNTSEYDAIVESLKKGCNNCPNWLELPNTNTSKIYFKENFLNKSSSEYYLWVDSQEKKVYLEVSYFD